LLPRRLRGLHFPKKTLFAQRQVVTLRVHGDDEEETSMDHVGALKKYLHDRSARKEFCVGYPFVTISRQAGAGGHTLARDIVREVEGHLNNDYGSEWEVFDHKLCLLIAQDPDMNVTFNELLAEHYRPELSMMVEEMLSGKDKQYAMLKRIFEIVRGLATIGKVVIVGRAGNYITADMPMGVRIRLVAGLDTRIRNMMELLDTKDRDEAERVCRKQDAERARLAYDFFNKDINDPLSYDATLNADTMTSKEMAQVVGRMIQLRLARYGGP
jgi:cytidylate kinase